MNNLKNMQYGTEIITYLNNIKSEIELYNAFKLYNINKFAEYFYAEFLNLLCGYKLEIMEIYSPNMTAIDLGDKEKRIAIQVTSDIELKKIRETYDKYIKNELNKQYDELIILYIASQSPKSNERTKYLKENNIKIWDIDYLIKIIATKEIDKLKNIHNFLKKYVKDSPQISNLDNFLKERYKNQNFTKLKALSSLNKDVYIKDIYQDLSIIKKAKNKNEKDEETTIDKILEESNKVAILGKSGIGKSTLSKYICYQWANAQLFDDYEYLFYIPIKKWEKGEGIFDVILKVLKESNNENIKIESDDLYEYIKTFNSITLFVIDGFDEIGKEEQEDIKKEIQNFDNYIISSRHDGLKDNELNIKETFENEGFNQRSIEKFIGHISNSHELVTYINENNQLKELSKIPMLLDMICYLYKENQIDFNSHFTMTALYEKFLDEIILRFEEERESQSSKVKKEDDDIFFELGKIAFDNLKDKIFKFKGTFITRSNRKFIKNELLPFGFIMNLTNERHLKDREYEFIHTSFQEYFSALYVSKLEPKKQSEEIQEYRFHPHMQMFFAFLGGLIGNKEFLLREIESEPRDLVGVYELLLQIECLTEIPINNISQYKIHDINKKLRKVIYDIVWTIYDDSFLFNKLKRIIKFLDFSTIKFLIKIFNERNDNYNTQKNIIDIIYTLSLSNTEYSKFLKFMYLKNKKQSSYISFYISLLLNEPYDEEPVDKIIVELKKLKIDKDELFYLLEDMASYQDIIYEKEEKKIIYIFNKNAIKTNDIPNWINNHLDILEKFFLEKEDNTISLKKTLLNDMKSKDFSIEFYNDCQKVLNIIEKNNFNVIDELFDIIEDNNIDDWLRVTIIYHLDEFIIDYKKEHRDKILYLLEKKELDIWIKNTIEKVLLIECIRKGEDEKIIDLLYENIITDNLFLEEEEILNYELRESEYRVFMLFDSISNSYIDKLIHLMKKKENNFPVYDAIELLSTISNQNFYGFKSFFLFEKKYNEKYQEYDLLGTYIKNIDSSVIFQAYDNGYLKNSIGYLINDFINPKKVFYLKNNKLHTIENGKEINTQREVEETTLNKIKMILKGDNLND